MTPKQQAIAALDSWCASVSGDGLKPSGRAVYLTALVKAVQEADREERGVVDVQEIRGCINCPSMQYDAFMMYHVCEDNGRESIKGLTQPPPPWCPRRKENRK